MNDPVARYLDKYRPMSGKPDDDPVELYLARYGKPKEEKAAPTKPKPYGALGRSRIGEVAEKVAGKVGGYVGGEVRRGGAIIKEQAKEAVKNPGQLGSALVHGLLDPVDLIGRNLIPIRYEADKHGFPKGLDSFSLSDGSDRGTLRERVDAMAQTAANVLAPGVYRSTKAATLPLAKKALGKKAGDIAASVTGEASAGGLAGAAFDPEHPISGGMVGGALGVVLGEGGRQVGKGVKAGVVAAKPGLKKVGGAVSDAATTASKAARELPDAARDYIERWRPKREAESALPDQPVATGERVASPPGQVTVKRIPVGEIEARPEIFQYKRGGDAETGAGGELKNVTKFDELLAGAISVWRDPTTGRYAAVNGHHRLDLAKRTGHPSINAIELPAKTPAEARTMGALQNIAEGRGTAIDAAQFFRDSGLGIDDLKDRVSFKGSIAKNGLALSKLAPDVFDRVVRGEVPENIGAAVGDMLDNPALQRTAISAIEKGGRRLSETEARFVARQVREAGTQRVSQDSLFGTEEIDTSLYVQRAQLAAAVQKQLGADKRLFGFVAKEGRAEGLARAGNVIDVEQSGRIAAEAGQLEEIFTRLATRSGPIADALTEGARRIANGEKARQVLDSLYPAIRDAVSEAVSGGEGARNPLIGRSGQDGELAPGGRRPDDTGVVDEGRVPDSTDPNQGGLLSPDDLDTTGFRAPRNDFEGSADVRLSPSEPVKRSRQPERLEAYAIRYGEGRHVIEGRDHMDAMRRATESGFDWNAGAGDWEAGYVTSTGRFVADKDAMLVALKSDQIRKNTTLYRAIQEGHVPLAEIADHAPGGRLKGIRGRDPAPASNAVTEPPGAEVRGNVGGIGPAAEPHIVHRGVKLYGDDGKVSHFYYLDDFNEPGARRGPGDTIESSGYLDPDTGKPVKAVEGYQLSDGTFITRDQAEWRFKGADIGPEGRNAEGPLFAPEQEGPDLFGETGRRGRRAEQSGQGSLLDEKAGTEASRPLTDAERAARGEVGKLRQVLALETDPQRRAQVARRVAELEKLVNRDQAISADELAARIVAEGKEGIPPAGPDQTVLLAPASQATWLGANLRRRLGIKNANTGDVVAVRKISMALAEAIGVPLRQGRGNLKRMRALGAFWTKPEMIRVRRLKALDTVSHEIGHYLSKKYNLKGQVKGLPKADRAAMQTELIKMGKDLYGSRKPSGGYGEEGVAQFFRFFVTDRARMVADAPIFSRYMDGVLQREPALLSALDKAHDDWMRFDQAPASEKIASMIERDPPSLFANVGTDWVIDHWFNDLSPMRRATEALGTPKDITKNAGILAELTKGNAGRARDMLDHGVIKWGTDQRTTRGLREILKEVGEKNRDAFTEYIVAEQVLTKTGQGIDTGFDVAAAREVVAAGRQNPGFVKAAKEVWDFRSALLDYLEGAGLLLPEELASIRKGNPTPTPFYRSFDGNDIGTMSHGRGARLARASSGVQRMIGSDRPILDPLQSIVSDAYDMTDRAHKHEAAAVLVKAAISTEGGARIVSLLPEVPMELRKIGLDRVRDQLLDAGWTPPDDPGTLAVLSAWYEKKSAGPRERLDNVIPVLLNGERKWVQINDRTTWDAIMGMSIPEVGIYERVLTWPTQALRMGATQVNPNFLPINPFRDAFPAAIYSAGPTRPPFYHIGTGLMHLLKDRMGIGADKLTERWAQMGGENAGMVGADKRTLTKQWEATVRDMTMNTPQKLAQFIKNPFAPVQLMRSMFEVLENATRVGEFGIVRRQRMKEAMPEPQASMEAAYSARNVTQDFFKSGSASRVVNRYVPFFAAQLGEINKLATEFNPMNLATPEGRVRYATVTARAAAMLTVPSISLYLLQKDDPAYQEVPEYIKANAWVLIDRENGPIPFTTRSGDKVRVWMLPRPHLLGFIFGYMPEKMLAMAQQDDPDALEDLAKNAWAAVTPPIIPTIAGPLIENYANRSLFTGRPIVPPGALGLEPEEQSSPRTGETARLLGRAVDYSPAKIENLARGYTGGAGTFIKELGDFGIRKGRQAMGAPPLRVAPTAADDPLDRAPVIGGFVSREPGSNAKSVERLFRDFDEAEQKRRNLHALLKQGRQAEAVEFLEKHREQIMSVASKDDVGDDAEPGELRAARKAMGDLTRMRREIAASDWTPEEKAVSERELERQMVQLARAYYEGAFKEIVQDLGLTAKRPRRPVRRAQLDAIGQALAEEQLRREGVER